MLHNTKIGRGCQSEDRFASVLCQIISFLSSRFNYNCKLTVRHVRLFWSEFSAVARGGAWGGPVPCRGIDMAEAANLFVGDNQRRKHLFGKFLKNDLPLKSTFASKTTQTVY